MFFRKKKFTLSLQLEPEIFLPFKFNDQIAWMFESNKKLYCKFNKQAWQKKEKTKKKNKYSLTLSAFFYLLSDELFYWKKHKTTFYNYKVIPTPRLKEALKNRFAQRKKDLARKKNKFFTLIDRDFSPRPYESKKKMKLMKLSFIDWEFLGKFKWPKKPLYWKSLHKTPVFSPTSIYSNFIEHFGEQDLITYDSDNATSQLLNERYFENHLSTRELLLKINQDISLYLNKIMNLLNEQLFLIFPLGASPVLYSILPELDGISREFQKHGLALSPKKRVSYIDIPVRAMNILPRNLLSKSSWTIELKTDSYMKNIKRNWEKLLKLKNFHIDELSLSCYSELSQHFLSGLFRSTTKKISRIVGSKYSLWNMLNSCCLIDNKAFSWSGDLPFFEKSIIGDNYKMNSFTHPRMFWERECKDIHLLDSSIRKGRPKKDISALLS